MKISVIIPSYKPGEYIKECLSSLKRQTLSADDFEIVVVLNGCDAPYQSVLEKYIQEENIVNAHVIHTDTPGVSNARNVGIDSAKGEYLLFLDDDDWVSDNYLSNLLALASTDTISNSNFLLIDDGSGKTLPYFLSNAYQRCSAYSSLNLFNARSFLSSACGKLIPRKVIGDRRFDTTHKLGEDSFFMFCISDRIKHIALAAEETVYYVRARQGSASRRKYKYSTRVLVAIRLTKSYLLQYFKNPFKYNFLFWASRVAATIIKLRKKEYV